MAKGRKKKEPIIKDIEITAEETANENIETSVEELVEEIVNTDAVEIIEEIPAEVKNIEEVIIEEKPTVVMVEVEKEVTLEDLKATIPQIKALSAKDNFLKNLTKTPFTIYQNGTKICHSNPYLNIIAKDKYFELSGVKYSYIGIEIKY